MTVGAGQQAARGRSSEEVRQQDRRRARRAAIVLLVTLGLRRGELLGLRWSDVDLKAGTLRVSRALKRTAATGSRYPRRRQRVRTDAAAAAHRGRRAQGPPRPTERGTLRARGALGRWRLAHHERLGRPVDPDNFRHRFIDAVRPGEDRALVASRRAHTAGSLMFEHGADLKVVSETLGHPRSVSRPTSTRTCCRNGQAKRPGRWNARSARRRVRARKWPGRRATSPGPWSTPSGGADMDEPTPRRPALDLDAVCPPELRAEAAEMVAELEAFIPQLRELLARAVELQCRLDEASAPAHGDRRAPRPRVPIGRAGMAASRLDHRAQTRSTARSELSLRSRRSRRHRRPGPRSLGRLLRTAARRRRGGAMSTEIAEHLAYLEARDMRPEYIDNVRKTLQQRTARTRRRPRARDRGPTEVVVVRARWQGRRRPHRVPLAPAQFLQVARLGPSPRRRPDRAARAPETTPRAPPPVRRRRPPPALDGLEGIPRAYIALAAFGGLRACEVAAVRREDIDEELGVLLIRDGKGGKDRVVPTHPEMLRALEKLPRSGYLFPGKRGHAHVRPNTVTQLASRSLRRLGINATLHQARHWYTTKTYALSLDIRLTQELMGHSSPATTARYTAWASERARVL